MNGEVEEEGRHFLAALPQTEEGRHPGIGLGRKIKIRRYSEASPYREEEGEEGEAERPPSFLEACENCDDVTVRYLLNHGLTSQDLNARDKSGKTGFSIACGNGFTPIVSLFSEGRVDVNAPDSEGNSPLILAAQAGHCHIVSLLLNRYSTEINVDQRNEHGFTALMKAALQGRSKCSMLLLTAGACPYLRDYGRKLCALEWAKYCSRKNCAQLIAHFMELSSAESSKATASLTLRRKSDGNLIVKESGRESPAKIPSLLHRFRRILVSLPKRKKFAASESSSLDTGRGSQKASDRGLDFGRFFSTPSLQTSSSAGPSRRDRKFIIPKLQITKDDSYISEYEDGSGTPKQKVEKRASMPVRFLHH